MTNGKLKTFDPKTVKFTVTHQYGARFDGMSLEMVICTHIADAISCKAIVVIPQYVSSWIFGGGYLDDITKEYLNLVERVHEYNSTEEFNEENFRVFMHKLLVGETFRNHFVDEAVKLILKDLDSEE